MYVFTKSRKKQEKVGKKQEKQEKSRNLFKDNKITIIKEQDDHRENTM